MKAITTTLYVCGSLMIAAAVMGAVDYSSASRKGTMNKLYKDEAPAVKAPAPPKEIGVEDYSRGEINPSSETVKEIPVKKVSAKKQVAGVVKRKKRITIKEFSRKAIPEDFVLPDSAAAKK